MADTGSSPSPGGRKLHGIAQGLRRRRSPVPRVRRRLSVTSQLYRIGALVAVSRDGGVVAAEWSNRYSAAGPWRCQCDLSGCGCNNWGASLSVSVELDEPPACRSMTLQPKLTTTTFVLVVYAIDLNCAFSGRSITCRARRLFQYARLLSSRG